MPLFAQGVPRLALVAIAIAAFCFIPTEFVAHGPSICVWSHVFHFAACPACGSTRALCAFFHGEFSQAMAYNRNVLVTAPLLVIFLVQDLMVLIRRVLA